MSDDIHQHKAESAINPVLVEISPDKMTTVAYIDPRVNKDISTLDVEAEIRKCGITVDIDQNALKKTCLSLGQHIIVARGVYPENGKDAAITYNYKEAEKKPVLCEDGTVNYYELGQITPIYSGETVAVRTPPTKGVHGYNVLGEEIPAQPGKLLPFNIGKGIVVIENKAIAEYDGALSWVNNKLLVSRMFKVDGDIDFSIGNINFMGKVLIQGSIKDGFTVEASDDIDIRGGIENACVTSRTGSVFVQNGIIGREAAHIHAHKNIEAKFIQEADLTAGQNIIINEYVIRSTLKAGDSVLIQGRKGKIMGNNEIKARAKIKAAQVQNPYGLQLHVEGINRKECYERINQLNKVIEEAENNLKKLAQGIRGARNMPSDPKSLEFLQKVLPVYLTANENYDQLNEERKQLVNMLKTTRGDGMIEVGSGLEAGMYLTIKSESIKLSDQQKHVSIFYDPDEKKIVYF